MGKKMGVKTIENCSDDKLSEELNKIGYDNMIEMKYAIDSYEDGYDEIVKIIYFK